MDLFPTDQLVSSGPEGADNPGWSAERSFIGGAGAYAGASGRVVQNHTGTNTTVLRGIGDNAPNFRFDFRVLVPEL